MTAETQLSSGAIASTTDAAVLCGPKDIRVESKELPLIGPHETLVEMRSGGICGSDMHYFADGKNGQNVLEQPTVLGHEGAGVVVAAGAEAGIEPGTPVVIEPAVACGACDSCESGRYNICPRGTCFGSPPNNGLFTRHAVVPESALHVLPPSISPEIGAAIEPLAVAVWAVKRAQVAPGSRVLVTGAGPIGLLVLQVAAVYGAKEIVVTDINDDRLRVARELGASLAVNTGKEQLDRTGYDRLIECSGNVHALAGGIRALAPGARATVVGQASPVCDGIPLGYLQRYEIDLVCAFRYAHAFPEAIALAGSGQINLSRIVTATFPLAEVGAALVAPVETPTHLKVLLTY